MIWTSRKFVLAAFSLVSSALLAAWSKLTGEYVTLVLGVVGAFSTADTLITRRALARANPQPEEETKETT